MAHVHWEASLVSCNHILHGAELLLAHDPPDGPAPRLPAGSALGETGQHLRRGYQDIARQLPGGRLCRPVVVPMNGAAIGDRVAQVVSVSGECPGRAHIIEASNWVIAMSENLGWLQIASGRPPRPQKPSTR